MNWINRFEIMCYGITLLLLWDLYHRRAQEEFWLFLSAMLAGFTLELLAVRVTDIYHYSSAYYVMIGFQPYQFPFFGGLMWGGLSVYGLRLAQKLKLNPLKTALLAGWLIVTMDLFLDVIAIRLSGGFWVWDGREVNLNITHHMFMSVIWVNFLGYMCETPAIVYAHLKTAAKRKYMLREQNLLLSLAVTLIGVCFVGAASALAIGLNQLTDEWFACIAFVFVWCYVLLVLCQGIRYRSSGTVEIPALIYWGAMYAFCLCGLWSLGIAVHMPWYFAGCMICMLMTSYLAIK